MKKIAVLLAAYNGERWLHEQISSILQQENVDVTIFISVDLSVDNTLKICQQYSNETNKIVLLPYGERYGGAAANFYRLIRDVDFSSFDCISFADQDDIWHKDKLFRGIERLKDFDAYSSNVLAFWEHGKKVVIKKNQPQVEYDYFFEAAGPGCTYVINRNCAMDFKHFLVTNWESISNISYHDWLLYAFARDRDYKWFIDAYPGMLYRQHAGNQVGANHSFKAVIKRIQLLKSEWYRDEVIKISNLFLAKNLPFKQELESGKYQDTIKMLFHISNLRRKKTDRYFLALAIIINIF